MKFDLIKQEFIEWTKNSTAHGITNLFKDEKPKFIRLMWFVLFIGSFGYCCYSIIISLINFLEFEVLINIDIEKDILAEYPTVSICNLNQYSTSHFDNYVQKILNDNNLKISENKSLIEQIDLMNKLVRSNMEFNVSDQMKKNSSLSLDKMIISCLFGAQSCTSTDFEWFYLNKYGNCYRFNYASSNKRIQTRSGKYYGLRLELYVGEISNLLTTHSGVHVFINNNTNEYLANGLDISTSFSTDLSLTRKSIHKLSKPHSDCIKNEKDFNLADQSEYVAKTISRFKIYQLEACKDLCIQDFIEKNCNCSSLLFPQSDLLKPICSTIDKLECVDKFYYLLFEQEENILKCQSKCPTECDKESFDYLISFSDYPSKVFGDGLLKQNYVVERFPAKNETSFDDLKKSILSLNIFYSSFDKHVINEVESITVTDFLGSIGGTLGLFIGISLLSVVELIELALIILFIIFKREKTKNLENLDNLN